MIKALLSFSLGGLVVFVPQGAKSQEKKPVKVREVHVVELDDVTEEVIREELTELKRLPKDALIETVEGLSGYARLVQEPKTQWVESMSKAELLKLLKRLENMSEKVKNLDGDARNLDRALVKIDGFSRGKNGLPTGRAKTEHKRELALLELKMAEIAVMRDRLQAQINTTRRYISQNRDKAAQKSAAKKAQAAKMFQVQADLGKAQTLEWMRFMERSKADAHKADVQTTNKALEQQVRKSADFSLHKKRTDLVRKNLAAQYKTLQGDQVVAKLEREIARLTRELARMNAVKGVRTDFRSVPAPARPSVRANPFRPQVGFRGQVDRAPRASGVPRAGTSVYRPGATRYRRRSAPSTLGTEGKAIWNELQGIRSDIRSLKVLMEKHIKQNSTGSRSGSTRSSRSTRGSVGRSSAGRSGSVLGGSGRSRVGTSGAGSRGAAGPLRGLVLTPEGVPVGPGSFGVTTLGPQGAIIVEKSAGKKSSKGVRYFWRTEPARAGIFPTPPKSGIGTHRIELLPLPAEQGEGGLRLEYKLHGEHDKAPKIKSKSTTKRGSVVSSPTVTESPSASRNRGSEIRRL